MMASFAVSASAFTDADKIEYNTAVEVLTGLGVISGYSDDTFRPTDAVTRGAFAKMVAYVMNGGTNAAASYGTYAAAAFSDVAANSTFGNAIGYVTNKGIVGGYANGTFRAGNKVTGLAAAKMLLGALGYSSDVEGYTGEKWSMNVIADGEDAGLFVGMASVDLTQPLTREQAAQMIWNALQATMVKYSNTGVSITTPDGTTVNTGASEASNKSWTAQYTGDNEFGTANNTMELVEACFPKLEVVPGQTDIFGRPTVEYQVNSVAIAVEAQSAAKTYVGTFTEKEKDALLKTYKATTTPNFVYNGDDSSSVVSAWTNTYGTGGVAITGYTVEIFASQGAITDVVVTEAVFGKVTELKAATKTAAATVKVDAYKGTTKTTLTFTDDPDEVDMYDYIVANFKKDDYVAIYGDNGSVAAYTDILDIVAVDSVSGTISKTVSGKSITMEGTAYNVNKAFVDASDTSSLSTSYPTPSATAKGTLYLLDGTVIGYVGESVVGANTAVLVTDVYQTLENGKLAYKYEGIVASGETTTFTGASGAATAGTVYEYTTTPATGMTTFAAVSATTGVADTKTIKVTGTAIAKGALSVTIDSTKCYFDSDVKFIFWGGTPAKATVLTGKQAVAATADWYAVITTKGTTNYISAVYVDAAPANDTTVTSSDIIFIAKQNSGSTTIVSGTTTKILYSYVAYVGGELVEEFYSEDDSQTAGFYKNVKDTTTGAYKLDTNGYNTTTGATAVTAKTAVANFGAGVLTLGTKDYDVSNATIIDLTTAEEGITTSASAFVVYNADTMVASYVFVVNT